MKKLVFSLILLISVTASSQVIVNKVDVNEESEIFEVYAFKKPFSTKEVYFGNYGQDNFKLHYYDHKRQAIYDSEGNKFEPGEWLKLYKYLRDNDWKKIDEREEKYGKTKGRVITFEKDLG